MNDDGARDQLYRSEVPIKEYATIYIFQVVEFARRCFDMAAQLAGEAARQFGKHDKAANGAVGDASLLDEELNSSRRIVLECNEECDLLLFNVLQEFSLIKEMNDALFPHEWCSRLIDKTLVFFQRG